MLSVTDLTSYMYCPRKLYLERVLGLVEPDNKAMVKGSLIHRALELLTKSEEELVKGISASLTFLEIRELYQLKSAQLLGDVISQSSERLKSLTIDSEEFFLEALPILTLESSDRASRLSDFIKQNALLGQELWASLEPKMLSELKIRSKKLELTGVIDRADFFKKEVIPVEIKTGKPPQRGIWPGHKLQLAAYAMLLKEEYGLEVTQGLVKYTLVEESRPVHFNTFHFDEVLTLMEKVRKLFELKSTPESCRKGCHYCGNPANRDNEQLLAERLRLVKAKSLNTS